MEDILEKLTIVVKRGKADKNSPYPPDLKGQDGADELTAEALKMGFTPDEVLQKALVKGMRLIGEDFSAGKAFVPEMLMAAKAMKAAMKHIEPFFKSGSVKQKGAVIMGTVQGDLHDIGKNLVAMMIEGAGWKVIDLGSDTSYEKFEAALKENPDAIVGMSALLTTTMVNMKGITQKIKEKSPKTIVMVGGAPLSQDFCDQIGADFYSPDPQGAIEYLNKLVS
ncbi:MAG TPA: cobalamin-binding protein [Bacteroidetes bacterium]|nr:cobalamin-binding protein [Bacteroidota bacterium]